MTYNLLEYVERIIVTIEDDNIVSATSSAELAVVTLKIETLVIWSHHFRINHGARIEVYIHAFHSCYTIIERKEPSVVPFGDDKEGQFWVPLVFQSNTVSLAFLQFGKGLFTAVKNLRLFFVQDHTILALADSISIEKYVIRQFLVPLQFLLCGIRDCCLVPRNDTFPHHASQV